MSNPNGSEWEDAFLPPPPPIQDNAEFDEFAPQTKPPSAPQTVATPSLTITPGVHAMQTYEAILEYNNSLDNFSSVVNGVKTLLTEWSDAVKGVVIHKIDQAQAEAIASEVKVQAPKYGLPIVYTLGCLAIESTLDPNCQNGNLGPGESNTSNNPDGYDMGVAQLKLRYLVGSEGITTVDEARAFALDVTKAIPYHCSIMAGNVLWATNVIQENTSSAPDPRMSNPLILGTCAYNFGREGVMTYYENGDFPSHAQQVVDLTNYFAKLLGEVSPFADLPSAK